jgi:hypothetical protein
VAAGVAAGAARARRRGGGRKGHARLKFEKDGRSLQNAPGGAPTSIARQKSDKIGGKVGREKPKKRAPPCARGFYVGINNILAVVARKPPFLTPRSPFISCHDELAVSHGSGGIDIPAKMAQLHA